MALSHGREKRNREGGGSPHGSTVEYDAEGNPVIRPGGGGSGGGGSWWRQAGKYAQPVFKGLFSGGSSMGNSSSNQNKMLGQSYNQARDFSNRMGGYGAEDREYGNDVRGRVTDEYWKLYNDEYGGMGGDGGGGYNPRENEAMAFYRDWMKSGGWSDPQMRDYRLRSEAVIPGFFAGIRRNLDEASQIRGGYAGYSGQTAKLAREKAQESERGRLGAEVELQDAIRRNRLTGASGVERLDREYMDAMRSASAARGAGANDAFRNRMSILGQLRGLRGESGSDIPYFNMELGGIGTGINAARGQQQGRPWWQTAAGVLGPMAETYFKYRNTGQDEDGQGDYGDYGGD